MTPAMPSTNRMMNAATAPPRSQPTPLPAMITVKMTNGIDSTLRSNSSQLPQYAPADMPDSSFTCFTISTCSRHGSNRSSGGNIDKNNNKNGEKTAASS